ncbi:MAG: mechanosensitive ion channel family protein [Phycisphaeraceae bacterium]|nr:mechanosensitive ion channel family protein [Phycisphaeraceae bacterium]
MDWKNLDWNKLILDRPLWIWLAAAATFVLVLFGIPIIRKLFTGRRGPIAADDWSVRAVMRRMGSKWLAITTWVLAVAAALLVFDPRIALPAKAVVVVMLAIQLARFVPVFVDWGLAWISRDKGDGASTHSAAATIVSLRWAVLAIVYALVLLLALQNLGIDITALIAGLGIGGIAVALAAQNILGDLFASLSIALDKPFVVGDFIISGSEMGTIEHIGLKTTRVRSLSGEQLVFANSDLLKSRIRNYKRMAERRVVFNFGVVYATAADQLEQIPKMVRKIIEGNEKLRFDRCHFAKFGGSSLDFEAVYYIKSPDYNAHMDALQSINLAIARQFRDAGIDFAFPSQTIYFADEPESESREAAARRVTGEPKSRHAEAHASRGHS